MLLLIENGSCGVGFSLRPISNGLSALASSLRRPIEIDRRLKPAPRVGKNVKLLLRQLEGEQKCIRQKF
jgi:hypothetical protein